LDNASAHVLDFENLCENIKTFYVPSRTTLVMQAKDEGLISALKSYYLHRMIKKLIAETDANNELTVHEFWQAFDILDCV
jgi:hypothetical protein